MHVSPESRAYDTSRFLPLRGVRTHVQVWGPDTRPVATVVALHHFYGSAQTYDPLGRRLAAAGVRTVAFDRVGFGLTERPDPAGRWIGPDAPYTRDFAVGQLRELLDLLDVDRAVVTGTSMGGTTALQFGLAHPDRTAHLVPVSAPLNGDASPPVSVRRVLRSRWAASLARPIVRWQGQRIDAERVGGSWMNPSKVAYHDVDAHNRFVGVDSWDIGLWWKLVSDTPPSLLSRLTELRRFDVAVTAVGATADRTVRPSVATRIASETGGRNVTLTCGHVVHQECPEGLAQVLLEVSRDGG